LQCPDLIKEFWSARESKKRKEGTKPNLEKQSVPSPAKKAKPNPSSKVTDPQEEDLGSSISYVLEQELPKKTLVMESWETQIEKVVTVGPSDDNTGMIVYVTWKDGRKSQHSTKSAHKKFPQRVLVIH
jgi:hypothetical protein